MKKHATSIESATTRAGVLKHMKHITRVDGPTTHGYQVRFYGLGHPGDAISRYFGDPRYGSPAKALRAAVKCRNAVLKDLRSGGLK